MTLRAFVVEDREGKFKDLFDVLKIAKSLGEQFFRVKQDIVSAKQEIRVIQLFPVPERHCYVVLVEAFERTSKAGVGLTGGQT